MSNCECGRLEQVENLFTDLNPTKEQKNMFDKLLKELCNNCWACGENVYQDKEKEVW
jgi:hypothetical protein